MIISSKHLLRLLLEIIIAIAIFMEALEEKSVSSDDGKYSIANLSAGKPEAASVLMSELGVGRISYGNFSDLNRSTVTVDT